MTKTKNGSPTKINPRLLTKKTVKPEPRTPETDEESSEDESRSSSSSSSPDEQQSSDESTPAPAAAANRSGVRTVRKQVKPTKKAPAGKNNNNTTTNAAAAASRSRVGKKRRKVVYKEIAKLQRSTNLLIPKAPFLRLVRELMMERSRLFYNRQGAPLHITPTALEALREAAECYLVSVFEDAYMIALHGKRVTLMAKDITLLMSLRNHDSGTQ